jgi:hypothetical protein
MHCDHDMTIVALLMLMPIEAASLFEQPFSECRAFHDRASPV